MKQYQEMHLHNYSPAYSQETGSLFTFQLWCLAQRPWSLLTGKWDSYHYCEHFIQMDMVFVLMLIVLKSSGDCNSEKKKSMQQGVRKTESGVWLYDIVN